MSVCVRESSSCEQLLAVYREHTQNLFFICFGLSSSVPLTPEPLSLIKAPAEADCLDKIYHIAQLKKIREDLDKEKEEADLRIVVLCTTSFAIQNPTGSNIPIADRLFFTLFVFVWLLNLNV